MINNLSIHYSDLFTLLESSMHDAEKDVMLISPFIKLSIIENLLLNLNDEAKLTIYTRWRLDEILSGVSDIEIWELICNKQNTNLYLSPNLHAKYYRFDNTVILGSANLTAKALVGNAASNFEILQVSAMNDECRIFELALASQSIQVNDELFEQVKRIVEQHESSEISSLVNELGINYNTDNFSIEARLELNQWLPSSRNPENLFSYYSNNHETLTSEQMRNAEIDLLYFPIPNGLTKKEFNRTISFNLLQMPIIRKIDVFMIKDRRFGEMADFLEIEFKLKEKRMDPKRSWQTLMRWLIKFFPEKYKFKVSNYSEIFSKI